ncbi:MAG: hypothetical protein AAF512_01750 [Pseudomonadota bacterium]
MRIYRLILICLAPVILTACPRPPTTPLPYETVRLADIQIQERDAMIIGEKIWFNESSKRLEYLTFWNENEAFASMGIAHFLWHPAGQTGQFEETFPELLRFMYARGVALPTWLQSGPPCPWNNRNEFMRDFNSPRMVELRNILANNVVQQTLFMLKRLEAAPRLLLANLPPARRDHVENQFYRVARAPNGIYALADYLNFKGYGLSEMERYNGMGWGLLQALESMPGNTNDPVNEFANAAQAMLRRRIENSQPAQGEQRWWPGWVSRLNTYRIR